jgi:hypothetical protein
MRRDQAVEKKEHLQVISAELGSRYVDQNSIFHEVFYDKTQVADD